MLNLAMQENAQDSLLLCSLHVAGLHFHTHHLKIKQSQQQHQHERIHSQAPHTSTMPGSSGLPCMLRRAALRAAKFKNEVDESAVKAQWQAHQERQQKKWKREEPSVSGSTSASSSTTPPQGLHSKAPPQSRPRSRSRGPPVTPWRRNQLREYCIAVVGWHRKKSMDSTFVGSVPSVPESWNPEQVQTANLYVVDMLMRLGIPDAEI